MTPRPPLAALHPERRAFAERRERETFVFSSSSWNTPATAARVLSAIAPLRWVEWRTALPVIRPLPEWRSATIPRGQKSDGGGRWSEGFGYRRRNGLAGDYGVRRKHRSRSAMGGRVTFEATHRYPYRPLDPTMVLFDSVVPDIDLSDVLHPHPVQSGSRVGNCRDRPS